MPEHHESIYQKCSARCRPEALKRPVVYVADPDSAIVDSIQLLLRSAQVQSVGFSEGSALLEKTLEAPPSCVIIAETLPDFTGIDFMQELKSRIHVVSVVPVILLGGGSKICSVVEAVKEGAWDYFEKPFIHLRLLKSVFTAIEYRAPRAISANLNNSDHTRLAYSD